MRFFLFLFLAVCCWFAGCKPDSDMPCRSAYIDPIAFSTDENATMPFSGKGDTLWYVNTTGDSLACIGADKIRWYKTFPVKNNPECPDDSIGFTINRFNYSDSLSRLMLEITAYKYDSLLTVTANQVAFNIPIRGIGVNDSLTYADSLQFGNRIFYAVKSYVSTTGDSLYYNGSFGVICFSQGTQRFYLYRFNNR